MNSFSILVRAECESTPRVVARAAGRQLDPATVSHAVLDPESTWPSQEGNGTVHLRRSVAAITDDGHGEVFAIASRSPPVRLRARPRDRATPRRSGGTGSTFANDVPTLVRRASSTGLDVLPGGKHYVVIRPGHGGAVLSSRNSERRRSSSPWSSAIVVGWRRRWWRSHFFIVCWNRSTLP